jgi:predicted GIY-YIG superfamily endonuclease
MDYKNGKIYMIHVSLHGADEVYIGSTTQKLAKRMSGHRSSYNPKYISSTLVSFLINTELNTVK